MPARAQGLVLAWLRSPELVSTQACHGQALLPCSSSSV